MKTLMISFFPDINVWVALSIEDHLHSDEAWGWMNLVPANSRIIFCRYTQLGLLRLLTNEAMMPHTAFTLDAAWKIFDQWLGDPRVEMHPEPPSLDRSFRQTTKPFGTQASPKVIGDCYLLAHAKESDATLVTFDHALYKLARKSGVAAVIPSLP